MRCGSKTVFFRCHLNFFDCCVRHKHQLACGDVLVLLPWYDSIERERETQK